MNTFGYYYYYYYYYYYLVMTVVLSFWNALLHLTLP